MTRGIELYILKVMKDQASGKFASALKVFLWAISLFYGSALEIIDFFYRSGLRKKYSSGCPVVSAGNITLGGTGKTPFTVFLAEYFFKAGSSPAVLTRGYGGDETLVLKDELCGARVFAGKDRKVSADKAVSSGSNVIILDDGFQHRRLIRDLDILLIDANCPFGNGKLFPRGILREKLKALERADIFVVTKSDPGDKVKREQVLGLLKRYSGNKLVAWARHEPVCFKDTRGDCHALDSVKGAGVIIVSGIGDPEYFANMVSDLGARVLNRMDYPDHHQYTRDDIGDIARAAGEAEKVIITKKDYVKIKELDIRDFEDKIFVLDIRFDVFEGKGALFDRLNSVIHS